MSKNTVRQIKYSLIYDIYQYSMANLFLRYLYITFLKDSRKANTGALISVIHHPNVQIFVTALLGMFSGKKMLIFERYQHFPVKSLHSQLKHYSVMYHYYKEYFIAINFFVAKISDDKSTNLQKNHVTNKKFILKM